MSVAPAPTRRLHPLAVRIMHWTNAVAMIVMILSGIGIYNDEVIFGWLFFPKWLLLFGDWAADYLLWHFAGTCSSPLLVWPFGRHRQSP